MTEGKKFYAIATLRGTFWTYASTYTGKLLNFVVVTILARLLSQDDFGLAGYAIVTINFLEFMSDVGIGSALIYLKDDVKAQHTTFWLNAVTSLLLLGLTWAAAPWVGAYFNDPRAIPLIRALALVFPISGLRNVQGALIHKKLKFKQIFIPDLISALSKGTASILLALAGFGAWSLVGGILIGQILTALTYWIIFPWRPAFQFSIAQARELLSYGLGIISVTGIGIFLLNIDYLFVGRYLGSVALGIYTLAFRLPELLIKQFCGTLAKVIFPVYARLRDDQETLNQAFVITMRYVAIITVPLGIGLSLVAEPFVLVFFSEKWVEAIPVVRVISIYALILSLAFNAGDIFKARGEIGVLTKLSLLRAALLVPTLWLTIRRFETILAVAWAQVVVVAVITLVTLIVVGRVFKTSFQTMLKAFQPALVSGFLMGLSVYLVLQLVAAGPPIWQLIVTVGVGAGVYVSSLWLLQRKLFHETQVILRAAFVRR